MNKVTFEFLEKIQVDSQFVSMVESRLPLAFKMFKDYRKRVIQLDPKAPKQTFDQFCKSIFDKNSQLIKEAHAHIVNNKLSSRKFEDNERNFKPFHDGDKSLKSFNRNLRTNEMEK